MDRLAERSNETPTIAPLTSRDYTPEQLRPLNIEDMSGDQILEATGEALASPVIEELRRPVGRVQFTHALIQATLAMICRCL